MRPTPFDHDAGAYQRPNQPWVCGLASDGQACASGPTERGRCPALAECVPARDGDRWMCNRSTVRGGACDEGPTPEGACGRVLCCTPVRNLRTMRGRFVTACALLTAAALLVMLSADWRNEVIAPGPLAAQHAQLLRRPGTPPQCSACHSAAADGALGWTASLVVGHGDRHSQSQLCMKCHDKTIRAELALVAHNVPPDDLRTITQTNFGATRSASAATHGEVACAACHREHHGAAFDLTAVDNAACQACHQQRYHSFAADHPDFNGWPYVRRTPIAFDHASHGAKHFPEQKQSFDCRACHVEDRTQTVQLLTGYEAACAACHDAKIATSVAQGVPMLVLPMLDVDALRAAGHEIGLWPDAASGDFDGRLPPAMKLLLSADPAAADAITTLGEDFDFFDVDATDGEQLAACATLATSIKTLLTELGESAPAAVRQRLATAIGRELSDDELNALVAGLSVDTLRPAVRMWLSQESIAESEQPDVAASASGAWFRDNATLSIRYRPIGHADPVLTGWLTLLASAPDVSQQPLARAMLKELSSPTAPGLCASCHSVEQTSPGRMTIHWRAADRSRAPRTFTKFDHGPHLLLPELADCTACHAIDTAADTSSSYANWNPRSVTSEFRPIAKQHCATCHTAKAAGDRCQSCHSYHVEAVEGLGFRVQGSGDVTILRNPEP